MEETKIQSEEFLELIKKMEAENAGQERYARKQYILACIGAAAGVLALVVVLVCVGVLLPRLLQTFHQADAVLENLESVSTELSAMMPELSKSIPELTKAIPELSESVPKLVSDLDELVNTSGEELSQTLQTVSAIDIESLNEAIQDLRAIVEPLAKLFGK